MSNMQSIIEHATKHSLLRSRLINATAEPIRKAVEEQKADAAKHPDQTYRIIQVVVPQWYFEALAMVQGGAPKFLGRPVVVGEHEEIRVVFWDPTMALDAGAPV